MANTATLVDTIPAHFPRGDAKIYEYQIAIDTTSSDLTVRTPATGNRLWVVGIVQIESNTGNLIIKSGTTKTKTFELAANQGIWDKVNGGFVMVTAASDALIVQASMTITSLTLYVIEATEFYLYD